MKNTMKDITRNLTTNELNEKKIQATVCKKANLQTFDALADFFFFLIFSLWKAGARQDMKCSSRSNCFYLEVQIFFDEIFWYIHNISKQKLIFLKRMMISFAFLGGSKEAISTVYARQPDQEYLDMIPMYQKHKSFFLTLVSIIFAKIFSFKAATYNVLLKFDLMNSFRFLADGI